MPYYHRHIPSAVREYGVWEPGDQSEPATEPVGPGLLQAATIADLTEVSA